MHIKKNISLFLSLFILISNSGLAFNVHYCGEKIAAISSVFSKEEVCKKPTIKEKKCCTKKQVSHKKCCSDKELNFKDTSEKIAYKAIDLDFSFIYELIQIKSVFVLNLKQQSTSQLVGYYCDLNSTPLYKLYCQHTFYA